MPTSTAISATVSCATGLMVETVGVMAGVAALMATSVAARRGAERSDTGWEAGEGACHHGRHGFTHLRPHRRHRNGPEPLIAFLP
ncbi:MAG TPA: hypothetical protein PKH51_11595, partial [Candidatus Sumerlaeota bacterium]|nr:hypothetical protein [Candidatus Sumerlaeota bacterium]